MLRKYSNIRHRGLFILYIKRGTTLIFSRSCEYALQAVTYLASQSQSSSVLARDISGALNIPPHYLGKILQTLVKHNILSSQKGKSGGFILNRSLKDIMLNDIIEIMEGPDYMEQCILGFPGCSDKNPCPVHDEWSDVKTKLMKLLKGRKITDLSLDLNSKLNYIKTMEADASS